MRCCPQLASVHITVTDKTTASHMRRDTVRPLAIHCPALTSVSFQYATGLDDNTIRSLAIGCTHLTAVDLSGCKFITHSGAHYLTQYCSQLRSVNFAGCRLRERGVKFVLMDTPQLLRATFNGLTPDTVLQLKEEFPNVVISSVE